MTRSLALTLNALGLYAVALVLVIAFAAQLLLNELPCPLCLLQRIQFAMLAVGPILNLRFGPRPSYYAVSLFTAIAGAAFATRQILLHIMPGDLGYGSALLGYHYYTWAFIGFAVAIIALAAMLLFDEQFRDDGKPQPAGAFARAAVRVRARCRLVGDRAHRAERGFDAAGMRLRRVSGQPGRLRTAQARAVRRAITPTRLSPHERSQTSVPEWDGQFRLVRVHHEHREELGRLRLAGIGADGVAVAG